MKKHLGLFLELGKVRISTLATISMAMGYILSFGGVSPVLFVLAVGVFLIASSSATINQIQERAIDAVMLRTQGRPLPTRRVSVRYAWVVAVSALVVGSLLILVSGGRTAMLLGFLTVFWYNAVYTPMKRVTAFAAVPGGVVGAIPPVIGWVAGGGIATDPRILVVALFFFIWQVPHFWLLLLFSCGKDYERAGLPSLTRIFTVEQIARITFMWIFATAVTCLAIPLFGIIANPWINVGLMLAGVWLVSRSVGMLRRSSGAFEFRLAFKNINLYVFLVISLLAVSGMIG